MEHTLDHLLEKYPALECEREAIERVLSNLDTDDPVLLARFDELILKSAEHYGEWQDFHRALRADREARARVC